MIVRFFRSLFVAPLWFSMVTPATRAADALVYFGTVNENKTSEGIYVSHFDSDTGALSPAVLAGKILNPSFINFHPKQPILYSIGQRPAPNGKLFGTVESFTVDSTTGKLTPINVQPAGGNSLCYVQIDATGKLALGASYNEGFVVAFPLQADGALREHSTLIRHSGSSVHQRQKGPHAHCIDIDPGNRFALVADLGLDQVLSYRIDPLTGTIAQQPEPFKTKPGAGPRHIAFGLDERHVYVISEIDSTLTLADYDPETGRLTEKQTVPLLPTDFKGLNTAAEVVVHPSGKFLYASNRGHDSLALFAIAPGTGRLTFVDYMREGIKHPRHFTIDPSGHWLLCGNRDANTVTVYRIDPQTGRLTTTPHVAKVPMPTCVKFFRP